jgi:hypothetical protein
MPVTYDQSDIAYDSADTTYDGGCISTITYDEPGVAFDDIGVTYDGCDHRAATPPTTPVVQQVGSGLLGRRGPYTEPADRLALLRRDDEDLLVLV